MSCNRFALAAFFVLFAVNVHAGEYYTWIDQNGDLRNSFMKSEAVSYVELEHYKELSLSDFVSEDKRIAEVGLQVNPKAPKEEKRKYYTWIEADGRTNNTEYASRPQSVDLNQVVINGGELASDFVDADELARKGFVRDGGEKPYYTWVDPTGRLLSSEYQPAGISPASRGVIDYTDRKEFVFDASENANGGGLGELVPYMKASEESVVSHNKDKVSRLKDVCCAQLQDADFYSLTPDNSVSEKLNDLSPSYRFPTGESYYVAVSLPISDITYGLKIKSFSDKGILYPVLLFLDENKEPTRYVTDSVIEYHPETWRRLAYLEGRIQIKSSYKERYVIIFSSEEDFNRLTREEKEVTGISKLAYSKLGSVEVSLIF
ncbi:MalM family protein [Litoribacillus peritrichatus]|uniref:MalM family protein n=1 Tax=Litoribacillus peritrichatus TaxID=718191 RepID=A0ABP7M2D0_9GAMM